MLQDEKINYNVDTAFTIGLNVRNPSNLTCKSREDVIESIRSGSVDGINVGGIVKRIRQAKCKETRKRNKLWLPWFSGGLFNRKRSMSELKQNNYIILDVDEVEDAEEMKLWLELVDKSLDFAFTSPSQGLKFVYRLDTPIVDDISYERAYRYLVADLRKKLGLGADAGAKGRAQACYFSHDPELWENTNCIPLMLSSIPHVSNNQGPAKVYDFPVVAPQAIPHEASAEHNNVSTFEEDYATAQSIVRHLVACGEISYDHWRKTAYAIKARFGEYGKDIFLLYAENDRYHDDHESLTKYWDSLGTPTRVNFPSLFWVARQYGWRSA